jgi:tripartite ATP-independent transporter DctP family solute receptor
MTGIEPRWRCLRRRVFGLVLAAMASAALLAPPASAQGVTTLRFALITPDAFPYADGARRFKELVEQRSQGKIKVLIYPGAQLGDERQINESILEGSVQIGVGAGAMANLAPIYNIVQLPLLINGQDHMAAVADGPVGEKLAQIIEKQAGFRVLAWFSTGDSAIETTKVTVHTPDDLKGLKIRAIETPVLVDSLRALGASPTPMAYPEVYTGLSQGVIEGATLDVVSVNTLKVYELAKHMTDWQQMAFLAEPRPVIMSAKFFDGLPKDQQEWIRSAIREAATHERQVFRDRMASIRKSLVAEGVEISKVEPAPFLERMKPIWNSYAEKLGAKDLLEQILALRKN